MHKLIQASVFAAIGVLVFASLLIPVVDDATATTATFENEGYYYLDKTNEDFSFSWDFANPTEFIINNETVNYTNSDNIDKSIVLGEKFAVRTQPNNAKVTFYGLGTFITADSTNTTLTVTVTAGQLSATNGATSKNIPDVSELYYIADSGPYVMKKIDSVAYLNSGSEIVADSEIYASGQTFSGARSIFWHMEGTVENMDYPDTFDELLQISNETINGQYSTKYNDLFELSNITFTAYNTYQELTYNVVASYFVVPATVTAEKTIQVDEPTRDILAVLPLILIAALVMGVLGYAVYSRIE